MQTDFIIALAWPEGMVSACGSWYDIFFARNKKYRVGHSALALVDSISGKLRYFDFGRYHAPKDFGRVRDVETDRDVAIKTNAKIEKNKINNLKEILLEIKSNESFHGEGTLYASVLNDVSYSRAYEYAKKIDTSLIEEANQKIKKYTEQAPDKTSTFQIIGLDQKELKIECWYTEFVKNPHFSN